MEVEPPDGWGGGSWKADAGGLAVLCRAAGLTLQAPESHPGSLRLRTLRSAGVEGRRGRLGQGICSSQPESHQRSRSPGPEPPHTFTRDPFLACSPASLGSNGGLPDHGGPDPMQLLGPPLGMFGLGRSGMGLRVCTPDGLPGAAAAGPEMTL